MNNRRRLLLAGLIVMQAFATPSPVAADDTTTTTIRVHVDRPTVEISPLLYGLFYEDLNFAGDGGLYAELVQNRSFEYHPFETYWDPLSKTYHPLFGWQKVERGEGRCRLRVERGLPLNRNNAHYLALRVDAPGQEVGIRNQGFDGIRVDQGASYAVSFYARRSEESDTPVSAAIEIDGGVSGSIFTASSIGLDWKKYSGVITADETSDNASLAITTRSGDLFLDMISLMPSKTYKGRANGLRPDLVKTLADLSPKFFRFPGGCIVHGFTLQNAYRWKDTVGDVANRRPNWNRWGYHQTYGLGFYEYFLLSEDLGAEPLPVLPVGVSCQGHEPYQATPMAELQEWVDDVVDLVEFANGSIHSKWGAVRSEMGHPEPFKLKYVCLGNEEKNTPQCRERIPYFVEALRRAHPEIKIIGTSGGGAGAPLYPLMKELGVDITDEHYYQPPEWLLENQDRFDNVEREGPKVFVGEYASRGNTLLNAVAEAAFLTGVERNSDIVKMACYAPLLAHRHHTQWKDANLIWFDKRQILKTPNYYVQQMFSRNLGDVYLDNKTVPSPSQSNHRISLSASLDKEAGEVILKLVNPNEVLIDARIDLKGVASVATTADVIVLAGDKTATNTIDSPNNVVPTASRIPAGRSILYPLPAMSLVVMRIGVE